MKPRLSRAGQHPRPIKNRPARIRSVTHVGRVTRTFPGWTVYDCQLRRRGDLQVVVTAEAAAAMRRDHGRGAGRGRPYPELAIETCVLLMAAYNLTLRRAWGLVDSILRSWGVIDHQIPSPATICRRRRHLEFVPPVLDEPWVLLIDATGVSIRAGAGWRTEKPGATDQRRGLYVKWHNGVDAATGLIMVLEVQLCGTPDQVRRVFWEEKPVDPRTGERVFKPLPYAWRVEVAHGQLGRSRRLAKSFENSTDSATAWLQLACIARVLNTLP